MMRSVRTIAICLFVATAAFGTDSSTLTKKATWSPPNTEGLRQSFENWLTDSELTEQQQIELLAAWKQSEPNDIDLAFETAVTLIASVDSRAKELVDFCASAATPTQLPDYEWLSSEDTHPYVRNNMRLYYAKWLGLQSLYNEVSEQLSELTVDDVADPASLLFFQAMAHHRLLEKDNSLPIIQKLLENSDTIPRRYATMARLMEADIKPLKTDTLDEISRLMDNIRTRLGHGRAGKRVRKEEDEVIEKLDKMIDELEKQAQKQQQQSQQQSQQQQQQQNSQQSTPMQDSRPGGIKGPGNVDPKKLAENANWGDLPPKEREEALQQLGEDLPSHYREVIEEYFQKLAEETP